MRLRLLVHIIILLGFVNYAGASDKDGQFAVKGIGVLTCGAFVDAKDNKKSSYLHFGGWIEGYISATNKALPSSYDIAPWQTTETIATIAYTACRKAPDANFAGVVDAVVHRLSKSPLKKQSQSIKLSHGKYSLTLPEAILTQVKQRLINLNFMNNEASDEELKSALATYQKSKGLTVTSLPDQYTLWNLLETGE